MTNESGFLETNGARIYYEVEGSGPPVVLIHAGVANLRMWDDQATALRDAYRVIRYDTRGFGETETDAVEFSNRADIAALLDHLGEASAHVVGLSRGGVAGYDSPDDATEADFAEPEAAYNAKDWPAISEWETNYWVEGPGQPS